MRATKDSTDKIAISIMNKTINRIEKRKAKSSLTASYVIDRDLNRLYSLMETIDLPLSKEQIKVFSNICQKNIDASSVRTMSVKTLRSYINDLLEVNFPGGFVIDDLSDTEFLALLDQCGV